MAKIAVAERRVKLPEGVSAKVEGNLITVTGKKGSLTRDFGEFPHIKFLVEEGRVSIRCEFPHRKEKALVGTFEAHLANMVRGVSTGFEYTMKTVYSHFPIKAKVDGNTFVVENFLGERHPRKAAILPDIKVQVKGDQVVVTGNNRESVGQTAANIERATKVTRRDIRVFQDGIYLISKGV